MKVAEKVVRKIITMKEGTTFKYQDLGLDRTEYVNAAKAIERLITKGIIKRATMGVFYKPIQSVFGELQPREEELLKPYLFENGNRIAYVTGASLYNRMGLTTQVPKVLKVASRQKRIDTQIGKVQVKAAKSYVDVTNDNYTLLELLDAIKDFKTISDLDQAEGLKLLKSKIMALPDKDRSRLLKYALKYPPRVRALLGALLDTNGQDITLFFLYKSLNPLTIFKFGSIFDFLPKASNWNIR